MEADDLQPKEKEFSTRSDMVSVLFLHHQNNVFSQEVS